VQPKLQAAVPFTPVTGPRVLVRDSRLKSALVRVAAQTIIKLTGAPVLAL
jgi:predicted N-acyltransferase